MIANELADRLRRGGFDAQAVHRDVRKFKKNKPAARRLKQIASRPGITRATRTSPSKIAK
jgi:hypothetical protein